MDKKVYERTRYQNIYRHKKNKNYVIMMSKPVKTSISRIDGQRIMDVTTALDIRDNKLLKRQKGLEAVHKEDFDTLWDKYITYCINIKKLAYNSINRKQKVYTRYLKGKIKEKMSKTNKNYWAYYINNCNCSDKQKNHMLKELKAFGNWCVEENYLLNNPFHGIPNYKVEKSEMKYWIPDEYMKFMKVINKDIEINDIRIKSKAYLVKMIVMIGFVLGDRIGETRALKFNCIDESKGTLQISHSIDYNPNSLSDVSHTKTYASQRRIDITPKLINAIKEYKTFLINTLGYNINNNTLIFYNHKSNKPYSDTIIRKHFKEYCRKAEVPVIRLYDLRHTYVATMMAEGVELYQISERLGHTNYSTTVNKYGHLSNEVRKEIAKTTDKYL